MNSIFQLAQAWLEHCRNAAEAEEGMDDYAASMWHEQAEEAEAIIKRHIDTERLSEDDPRINPELTRRLAE